VKPFSPFVSRSSVTSEGQCRLSVSEMDRPVIDGERSRWAEPEGLKMEIPTEKKIKDKQVRSCVVWHIIVEYSF